MFWEKAAWAMAPQPTGGEEGPPQLNFFYVLIPLLLIFWVFLILPQKKQQKQHRERIASLKKGDQVVTQGGIYGTVVKSEENAVVLSIADVGAASPGKKKGAGGDSSVNIRVAKSAITTILERSVSDSEPES